jgi:urea transport system ATP-binding protein
MTPALLEITGLTVRFDGFPAVDGVDLAVAERELRFLIGPNGAGKTTLLDAVTGLCWVTGSVRFAGHELLGMVPHRIVRRGVGRTFQTPAVFDALTVVENIDLAASHRRRLSGLLRRRGGIAPAVADALEVVGLTGQLSLAAAGALSHGRRQWLEIAMLLAQDPRLLLLDEPVAGMTKAERERTGQLLQGIVEDRTVMIIEHDMDFLRRFARRVTVLHEGRVLSEGTVDEVQADDRVREVYLGRAEDDTSPSPSRAGAGEPAC